MPPRGLKRKSNQSVASEPQDTVVGVGSQTITAKMDSLTGSPMKKRRVGITIAQKQALLDNLQLEVTERARKLRAQYNLQAQGLRTRIEIRVNRIPVRLRRLRMGELLQKHAASQPEALPASRKAMGEQLPPPVPDKDLYQNDHASGLRSSPSRPVFSGLGRPQKRQSDAMAGGDKENQHVYTDFDGSKKRSRTNQTQTGAATAALSPASSNSRLNPRDRERGVGALPPLPAKPFISRPVSPAKQAAATTLLSTMVEKARSTRAAATRKATTSSTSSAAGGTRARKTTTTTASRTAAAAAARTAHRASGVSESSDASTSTVVRKTGRGRAAAASATSTTRKVTATAAAAAPARKTVMSSIRKGVASATAKRGTSGKTAAAAAAAAGATAATTTTRSGRILRKRD